MLKNVADMSLLAPTSTEYYKSCLEKKPCFESMMEDDPLPDADVRFMTNGATRTSPASLFFTSGTKKRRSVNRQQPFCVVVGIPNHVAVAIMWPLPNRHHDRRFRVHSHAAANTNKEQRHSAAQLDATNNNNENNENDDDNVELYERVEYFDSRGFNADKQQLRRVKAFFEKTAGAAKFVYANPDVDFQLADNDVCCHTWIYYFIYMRLAHHHDAKTICDAIHALRPAQRLDEVRRFQAWLFDGLQLTLDQCEVVEDDVQGKDDAPVVQAAQQQQVCTSKSKTQETLKPSKQPYYTAAVAAAKKEAQGSSAVPQKQGQIPSQTTRLCHQNNQLGGIAAEPDSIEKVRAFTVTNSHSYILPQTSTTRARHC